MKKSVKLLLLSTFVVANPGFADQNEFDNRQEQSARHRDFDVEHYRIALTIDDDTQSFSGQTIISLSSLADDLQSITLDIANFTVDAVKDTQNRSLEFTQDAAELTIFLHHPLQEQVTAALWIEYSADDIGVDKNVGLDFRLETATHPQMANSLNWPIGARYWFPSFDHPSDWATHETIVTVKGSYSVVANGTLVSDKMDPDSGLRTVHWRQTKPQPTYLYSFAAGPFKVLKDQHGELPVHYWVYPDDEAIAMQAFASTPAIIGFYEDLYGTDFPWMKYDQIVVPGMPGGAESTSATLITRRVIEQELQGNSGSYDWLIAHEIAHQWWGDLIGFRDWTHVWLSESFASDGEYLFILDDDGPDAAALYLLDYKDAYLKEAREKFYPTHCDEQVGQAERHVRSACL